MVLHIFNPGHDEALAAHTPYYTDTKAAKMLTSHLWNLPNLWKGADDLVLSLDEIKKGGVAWENVTEIRPWGWDAALCKCLQRGGAPERLLPEPEQLEKIRALSSRKSAVTLLSRLPHDGMCRNCWCESEETVRECLEDFGRSVVKSPWSCSGRGVFGINGVPTEAQWSRIRKIISSQGAVEIEPYYHRIEDAALIFECGKDGRITYLGLSRFLTNENGDYLGNLVSPDFFGRTTLREFDLAPLIDSLRLELETLLSGCYSGVLGVDIMVIRKEGAAETGDSADNCLIHPCIELNLRPTMGWVALQLSRHPKVNGRRGVFETGMSAQVGENAEILCGDGVVGAYFTPETE